MTTTRKVTQPGDVTKDDCLITFSAAFNSVPWPCDTAHMKPVHSAPCAALHLHVTVGLQRVGCVSYGSHCGLVHVLLITDKLEMSSTE